MAMASQTLGETKMRVTLIQDNPIVGNIQENLALVKKHWDAHNTQTDLIIFSELFICGYPPEDLVLRADFVKSCENAIEDLVEFSQHRQAGIIIGSPSTQNYETYNSAFVIKNGQIIHRTHKYDLPNYGVFDEKRLFKSDDSTAKCFDYMGMRIGIEICEDLWSTARTKQLKADGAELLVVINGSPFTMNKQEIRYELAQDTRLPVIYVNQYGGQDDLVFDGASFVTNAKGEMTHRLKDFAPDSLTIYLNKNGAPISVTQGEHYHLIYEALKCGLRDYIRKNGFKGVLIGLSGGIDSALSAVIAADALGAENIHTVMLPSPFTSDESHEDAKALAENLDIEYDIIPIVPMMEAMERSLTGLNGLAHENMQSRARGLILMTLSNQKGLMVLTTGNKSEMACGYATLYGDMCGGYNVLKDLYKTEVYALSRWINANTPYKIPERIITKVPTAELRENQTDQDSLPPYEILDDILEHLIEFDEGFEEIEARGHDRETIEKVWTLLDFAEYKRRQSAPGVKITSRAFGRDRRYPITNKFKSHI